MPADLRTRVLQACLARGLKPPFGTLARLAGVKPSTLSRKLTGTLTPDPELLRRLEEVLGLTAGELSR